MCGRYTLTKSENDVAKRFNIATKPKEHLRPNYNVAPTQTMPVITEDEDGKRELEFMKWGIPRFLGKDLVKELINTRSDKAFGGFWRKTVCNHRCLIPANGFYEWKTAWLEPSNDKQEKLEKLLFPSEDNRLEIYEVSRDVNNVRNNKKELLQPAA
jgi:putative SOS response-associated peptidase YedK